MDERQPAEDPWQAPSDDTERADGAAGQHDGTAGSPEDSGAPSEPTEDGSPEESSPPGTGPQATGALHETVEKLKYIATRPQF